MAIYFLYGLLVSSEIELPLSALRGASGEITVRFAPIEDPPFINEIEPGSHSKVTEDGTFLFWEHVGTLLVCNGREILVDPAQEIHEALLQAAILGPAMATILQQRGRLMLHASAVAVDDTALLLLGDSGAGKSTLAMEFYARGYKLIADDITSIEFHNETPVVFPSYPLIRVERESLIESLGDAVQLINPHYSFEKQLFSVVDRFVQEPLPLRHIYVLDAGEARRFESLSPRDALIELIRHSYALKLFKGADAPSHLRLCAELVKKTAIRRITIGRYDHSRETARLVADDVKSQVV